MQLNKAIRKLWITVNKIIALLSLSFMRTGYLVKDKIRAIVLYRQKFTRVA